MKLRLSPSNRPPSRLRRWIRFFVIAAVVLAVGCAISGGVVYRYYASEAARVDITTLTHGQDETIVLDARGEVVGSVGDLEREIVTIDDVSPLLVKAIIATEDARFYSHHGFDIVGLGRAAITNFTAGGIRQGGSTITQQLARNAFGLQERNYERKIKEIFLAMRIEDTWSKKEILTHYLNRIYLGHGFYGVGAAARGYFGKDVRDLDLAEAATIAGIIKAPVSFSPITRPDLARQKRDLTLRRMADTSAVSKADASAAMKAPMTVHPDKTRVRTGYTLAAARAEFQKSGLKPGAQPSATTTLRLDWQRKLDDMTRRHLDDLDTAPNKTLQSAVVVLNNHTGKILAMQGGRDYVSSPFNRALDGRRPAGTAFLPLVYATAFTLSADAASTKIVDAPLDNRQAMIGGLTGTLGEWGDESGSVAYEGSLNPLEALLEARTAATVRLGYATGLDKMHDWLQSTIFTSPLRTEAAFTLGQSSVSPIELARAYTAIATDGTPSPEPSVFTPKAQKAGPTFTATSAHLVRETMLNTIMRPEYRDALVKNSLAGRGIAGFGGIAYGRTDAWFVGFDRDITCVVWVGHDKDAPISANATAATTALPLWAEVFAMVTEGDPKSWGARTVDSRAVAVAPRAEIVADENTPLIKPTSAVVIGKDPYRTTAPERNKARPAAVE